MHCKIDSLAPLRRLTKLQQLRYASCKWVSSLEALSVLTSLTHLVLHDCPLVNPRTLPSLQSALLNLKIV